MNDYNLHVDSFDENCWSELIDYGSLLDDVVPRPIYVGTLSCPRKSDAGVAIDASLSGTASQISECAEDQECRRKRFSELSAILEPGRPMKTDKSAILGDAIRVLNQLKTESQEYKETNEKLLEEIKTLKADKERIEQQLKTIAIPPTGFMPAHPSIYPAGTNKMPVFPSYSYLPMWQYLPPSRVIRRKIISSGHLLLNI
ncbi:hypothetical protein DH2020_043544 [Rehmannia glutinosa]|uniref:BHLH domain-containing protein n=1 Tax=Rehmannia glutinosa TaxID=99300 RepID=A0ABR0UKL3_REHGL